MNPVIPFPVPAEMKAALKILVAVVLCFSGTASQAASLESSNPFLPPRFDESTPTPVDNPLAGPDQRVELRGAIELAGEWSLYLQDPTEEEGEWVRVGDESAPWFVRSFDPVSNAASVQLGGRFQEVALAIPGAPNITAAASTGNSVRPRIPTRNPPPNLRAPTGPPPELPAILRRTNAANVPNRPAPRLPVDDDGRLAIPPPPGGWPDGEAPLSPGFRGTSAEQPTESPPQDVVERPTLGTGAGTNTDFIGDFTPPAEIQAIIDRGPPSEVPTAPPPDDNPGGG